jgi:hypothetical protein
MGQIMKDSAPFFIFAQRRFVGKKLTAKIQLLFGSSLRANRDFAPFGAQLSARYRVWFPLFLLLTCHS